MVGVRGENWAKIRANRTQVVPRFLRQYALWDRYAFGIMARSPTEAADSIPSHRTALLFKMRLAFLLDTSIDW